MATPPKNPLFNALPADVQQAILTVAGIPQSETRGEFAHAVEARVEAVLEKKGGYNDLKDILVNALPFGNEQATPALLAAAEKLAPGQGKADIGSVVKAEAPANVAQMGSFMGFSSAAEHYASDMISGMIEAEKHVKPTPVPHKKPASQDIEVATRGRNK